MTTQEIAADLTARMSSLKRGSLSVFGDVFGGRIDNVHTMVAARGVGDCLILDFDGGETLQVWHPWGVTASEINFRIQGASRVRWEWFYYGRQRDSRQPPLHRTRASRQQDHRMQ